jgi:hypothetical protein
MTAQGLRRLDGSGRKPRKRERASARLDAADRRRPHFYQQIDKQDSRFKHNIAIWFDNSMDRLSGWYKRRTQWVSFGVALTIAVIFNVNALYKSAQIWSRPSVIARRRIFRLTAVRLPRRRQKYSTPLNLNF